MRPHIYKTPTSFKPTYPSESSSLGRNVLSCRRTTGEEGGNDERPEVRIASHRRGWPRGYVVEIIMLFTIRRAHNTRPYPHRRSVVGLSDTICGMHLKPRSKYTNATRQLSNGNSFSSNSDDVAVSRVFSLESQYLFLTDG